MIIDTHVHYNLEPLWDGWKGYFSQAEECGVQKHIIVGTNLETSLRAHHISQEEKHAYWSLGIHPNECNERIEQAVAANVSSFDGVKQEFEEDFSQFTHIIADEKCVAVGEIGLDYYHLPQDLRLQKEMIQLQKYIFGQQIRLAQTINKPIIVHVRDKEVPDEQKKGNAYWDALEILQEFECTHFTLHCVSGPLSYVKAAVKMGGYMGFDGNITYPNAQHIREIFSVVPEDRRLLETDAPFLPPQEFRGKICEPWMIQKTTEFIVKELGGDINTFSENSERLFRL